MAGIKPDALWDVRKPQSYNPPDPDGPISFDGGSGSEEAFPDEEGFIKIPLPDGSMEVRFVDQTDQEDDEDLEEGEEKDDKFDSNIANDIDQMELTRIAEMLIEGIDQDNASRDEWLSMREESIKLLGLKIERPRTGPGGGTTGTPLQGMATAQDVTLLEAVVRGQANAIGEFMPASGPAKIEDVGDGDDITLANNLEKNFNYWLMNVCSEYGPDTKRMFAWLYFGGSGFKKCYHHPLKRRPTSESVDPQDLIVSNASTDLQNAERVTHVTELRQSEFRRLVMAGHYRDIAFLPPSQPTRNVVEQALETIEGVRAIYHRPEDTPHTIYETYCELEIEDDKFVPKEFKKFAVPLPYRVSIEKDSREILEIRRDWRREDEECKRRKTFIRWSFIDWLGFYGLGLMHLIGNLQLAITAMLRIAIDNGMFANFPGGLMAKKFGAEQTTNNINPGPGQFAAIDLAGLDDINKAVMKMPYSDVTGGLLNLITMAREFAQRVAGTADLPVGEGKADIPVGTILAMIEQSSKVESAVHKGMHQAQAEEFEVLLELLQEDPGALFRHLKKRRRNQFSNSNWNEDLALKALNDFNLIPKSDPNTPSHIHRIMKTVALLELVKSNPAAFDIPRIMTEALTALGYNNPQDYLNKDTAPKPPSPEEITAQAKMKDAGTKEMKALTDAQTGQRELADKAAGRASEERIADKNLAKELIIHAHDRDVATAQHGLDQAEHHQRLREHALDAATAAHDAAMDVHGALQEQQEPEGGGIP